MKTKLTTVVQNFLDSRKLSRGTRNEHFSTLKKWNQWSGSVSIEQLGRKEIREFLDCVYQSAVSEGGNNPGRTANKARENLHAVLRWAFEQDLLDALPRFPQPREQRSVTGRYYLTKGELNDLYWATHRMKRPLGWSLPLRVGAYWRSALVVFFNYGVDTGTVWKSRPFHEPLLWRHVSCDRESPDRQVKELSRWGWMFYRRVKTGKPFYRPMNQAVHVHLKSIMPENPTPDDLVFRGGSSRPNKRFQQLCELAGIKPKVDVDADEEKPWLLKALRKTCATYYDQHVPESSIEILGHSIGGITYRHYAHRSPLAFKAIMTMPQPSAFTALVKGYKDECPCCRRRFDDAG